MKSSKLSWKIYYGTSEGKPKQRYENYKKSLAHEKQGTDL